MASAKSHVHSRRCLRGPALFLALWAVLLCSVPAVAADRTNPAGTTITKNPGLEATADGDRLTNLGTIKATATGTDDAVGMGDPNWASPHTGLTLTNNGSITASATGNNSEAYGMTSGANSTLANSGAISASATGDGSQAYGMEGRGAHSSLANSGTITASTTGSDGRSSGMYANGANSTLANSGTITATATGTSGEAYGMRANNLSSTLSNSGSITASTTGGRAYGMFANGDNNTLTNSGTISASATGGTAFATRTYTNAYGMYTNGDNSSLTNSGTITASATGGTAFATGIGAYANAYGMSGGANSTLTNSGTITAGATGGTVSATGGVDANAYANAYGMYTNGDNSSLTNSGTITASATGGTVSATGGVDANAYANAYGMYTNGDNSSLTNSGTITASATGGIASATGVVAGAGANAYGMYGGSHNILTNTGTITAIATGGTASATGGVDADADANAYGMFGGANSTLINSGTITASATGGTASATGANASADADAYGMYGGDHSTLANSGTITVSATGDNGQAYGIALYSGTAANYGLVRVLAANPANAWEVYGSSNDPAKTVYITNWATDLRDFTTYKFFGSDGSTLNLTGSRLTLRPGTAERGFAWGREYAVSDLAGGLANGWGRGAVASVTQEVPWARAQLTGTDWTDQKLSLHPNFTRKTNIGQGVASQGIAFALNQARGMERGIDGQRSQNNGTAPAAFPTASAPESGWSGFLTPYYSYIDNSDLDYDAKIAGFMAGATRRFSDAFAAGIHLGFSHADVSADLADQDGEALTGLFGLHAIYNATPEWYLRGQLTGFISRATNDWESGLPVYPLYTDADVNSRGLYASLATGYDWHINASNTITPEIGLSWLWSHQDSFSLNWKDRFGNHLDNYDLDYKAQDYNALYGTAMVRWRGSFDLAGGSFQPAVGVGVRQTLTDGDVKSRLTTAGSSFSTKATEDETTALAEAGFVWQRGITSVGLTYTGGYGDDQVVHTGWLTLKLEF